MIVIVLGIGTGTLAYTGKGLRIGFSINLPARIIAVHAAARGIRRVTSVVILTVLGEIDVTFTLSRAIC